ncbi:alpha/beta fold hydrolase [Parabacteroides sp. PF5-6]|uniref:alpha/beta hydrolase n=1 Tax=Parabacteroides sp. PF5-6 TaxID=1742403 RepID=UPI002404C89D|nr:alpha/beta fold hydrolase [Parabacteroides sp. PF5-6]MDF9831270.1 pimeloyl-ACP methyl ester carboxylesterase [Parabacteroides sp. PF5-6]
MKNKSLCFVLLLLVSFSVSAQLLIPEEPVTLQTATGEIKGTLKIPVADRKIPVALLIAGSGPTDRNGNNPQMQNNSLLMIADGLYQKGIASLAFDKRGIGESRAAGGEEKDLRFEHYINDVKEWIDLLSRDKRFSEVVVIGHSEGSLIGMVASRNNPRVDKYISLAGVGVKAGDILREQLTRQLATQPETLKETVFSYIEQLEKGQTIDDVPAYLHMLFRPSVQPYMISWFQYDPQKEIAQLTIPILIVQGTTDIQVGIDQAELLAKANPKARPLLLEGMNHVLKTCDTTDQLKQMPTYTDPKLPLHKDLLQAITDFIE